MMDKITMWAQGLVIAVIIGTIIEMILPEGNSKKYIKTVIGVYILYVIISPFLGENGISEEMIKKEYEKYFGKEKTVTSTYQQESSSVKQSLSDVQIESVYLESIKSSIVNNMAQKGYDVSIQSIELELEDEQMYGMINRIEMTVKKQIVKTVEDSNLNEDDGENRSQIESVNNVEIKINDIDGGTKGGVDNEAVKSQSQEEMATDVDEGEQSEDFVLSKSVKVQLKKYLNEVYGIKEENIIIN